jgi:MIP family channel proteins
VEASRPEETAGDVAADAEAAAALGSAEVIPARGPAAYVAEFIGTFALVFFITMVVSEFLRQAAPAAPGAAPVEPPFIDWSVIGLVHIFVLFMLIQTLAVVSGAHFNPAITAALATIRQIRLIDAGIYVLLQFAGGICGALLTRALLTKDNFPNANAFHWGAVKVGDILGGETGLGMLVEGIGTFFLVWAVVGVAVNPHAFREWAGLVIGGTLGFLVMVSGPLTGAGFNPARSFGPALVNDAFSGGGKFFLVFILAPVIGGVLAAFVYMRLFLMPGKKGPFGMGPVG